MIEPFKNLFSTDLIDAMADHFARHSAQFDRAKFVATASDELQGLPMMARADRISSAIVTALPLPFDEVVAVLRAALHPRTDWTSFDMQTDAQGIAGWAIVPMANVIARKGLGAPDLSLAVLRDMTMRFSAEFAIRPFFRDHPDVTFQTVAGWLDDPNPHVRRLISEGSRPRLPWGIRLQDLVRDPKSILPLLTALRDDPSNYVRKSVANSLNDIAKDHPDLVAKLAADWLVDASPNRRKLIKHGCRTLIKQGHPGALEAFGFPPPDLADATLVIPPKVKLGETLPIKLALRTRRDQRLLVDYVIHFKRANGKLSPKVFKWTEITSPAGEMRTLTKRHAYAPVTTRKDYAGAQAISIQVNGQEVARRAFTLSL